MQLRSIVGSLAAWLLLFAALLLMPLEGRAAPAETPLEAGIDPSSGPAPAATPVRTRVPDPASLPRARRHPALGFVLRVRDPADRLAGIAPSVLLESGDQRRTVVARDDGRPPDREAGDRIYSSGVADAPGLTFQVVVRTGDGRTLLGAGEARLERTGLEREVSVSLVRNGVRIDGRDEGPAHSAEPLSTRARPPSSTQTLLLWIGWSLLLAAFITAGVARSWRIRRSSATAPEPVPPPANPPLAGPGWLYIVRDWLAALAARPILAVNGVLTLAFIILFRNFLESVLEERHRLLGGPSFAEHFDPFIHFPLFYLAIYLSTALHLHLWWRGRVEEMLKLLLYFLPILFLPPLVDGLLVPYAQVMAYPSSAKDFFRDLLHIADPWYHVPAVTVGMRLEIVLAGLGAGIFAAVAPRTRWPVVAFPLAVVTQVSLIWAHGYFPGLVADLVPAFRAIMPWLDGSTLESQTGATLFDASSAGLTLHPGQLISAAFMLEVAGMALLLATLSSRRLARGLFSNLRPTRLAHYLSLYAAGVGAGGLYRPGSADLPGTLERLEQGCLALVVPLSFLAQAWLNDLYDLEGDRLDSPNRPVPSGLVSRQDAALIAVALIAWTLVMAACFSFTAFTLVAVMHLLGYVYSAPPFRLKRLLGGAHLLLGLWSLLCFWLGASTVLREHVPTLLPGGLSAAILLCITAGSTIKDLKDVKGDAATGVVTLPVLLGARWGGLVTGALFTLVCVVSPVLIGITPMPLYLLPLALALGVLAAHPRRHVLLFPAYILYGGLLGWLLSRTVAG